MNFTFKDVVENGVLVVFFCNSSKPSNFLF